MRRLLALLALAALAPLGCGGGDAAEELTPESAVAQAATKTERAGSSRMSFAATMAGGGLPRAVRFSGEGEFDYESRTGRATYDMSELIPGAGPIEIVMDRLVVYMEFPASLAGGLPEGKSWLKLDLEKLGEATGIDLGALAQMNQGDPTQILLYLRGASDRIEEVGEESVRGAETTHYRASVSFRKALQQSLGKLPPELRESARMSIERLIEAIGSDTVPVDVWIDEDGRARRMRMAYDMNVPSATEPMSFEMDFELYDFGVTVDAEPPPADEVADLQELLQGGSS
jgi:hypothetical protein